MKTANGKRTRTPSTVRGMLDMIDRFLASAPDQDARALWDILTALRGPDEENQSKKEYTTLVRRNAFPHVNQTFGRQATIGAVFYPSFMAEECKRVLSLGTLNAINSDLVEAERCSPSRYAHDLRHMQAAIRALLSLRRRS